MTTENYKENFEKFIKMKIIDFPFNKKCFMLLKIK